MQDFTPEQIQERFDRLPKDMQDAISSPEIHAKVRDVGNKNGLMIDQIGELVDQVGLVMLGLARASNFVRDTSARLSIDAQKAQAIAVDINKEVFEEIKRGMRNKDKGEKTGEQRTKETSVSSLEHAGKFTIEPEAVENNGSGTDDEPDRVITPNPLERATALESIEDPEPSGQKLVWGLETLKSVQQAQPTMDWEHSEPLTDQLLRSPAPAPAPVSPPKPAPRPAPAPIPAPISPPKPAPTPVPAPKPVPTPELELEIAPPAEPAMLKPPTQAPTPKFVPKFVPKIETAPAKPPVIQPKPQPLPNTPFNDPYLEPLN
jgi:hypothetical protein